MLKLKPVIAATALFALAGSSFVYAQQRSDGSGDFGPRAEHQHHQRSAEDINAFADARIAALKAGLELTPDQAKNWPPFETALRNMVQLRVQRMQARQAARQQPQSQPQSQQQSQNGTPAPATPFDRMERRADAMAKRSAALKQLADAGGPLYQSLNDAQKARFTTLARILRPHHHDHANAEGNWREGRGQGGGWGREGHRFGQDGRSFEQDGRGFGHGHRFGQGEQDGQDGRDGQGWSHERRFGDNDGSGWGHHHRFDQNGGGMRNMMGTDTDQDDSQL